MDNLNARIYGVDGQISSIIVTSDDYEKRIRKEWYPNIKFEIANNKEELMKKI